MCSVLGVFGLQRSENLPSLRREYPERSQKLRHRRPDGRIAATAFR